ncbi:MAG: response regulator [Alphaproteobacteria bacterium]|nr:response regulator [Alphaproteobacteria bacterium]
MPNAAVDKIVVANATASDGGAVAVWHHHEVMHGGGRRAVRVLVVAETEATVARIFAGIRQVEAKVIVDWFRDGEEALSFLLRRHGYRTAVRPDLVLVDPMLPGRSGWDVMREISDTRRLEDVAMVVLASSDRPMVVEHAAKHAIIAVLDPAILPQMAGKSCI